MDRLTCCVAPLIGLKISATLITWAKRHYFRFSISQTKFLKVNKNIRKISISDPLFQIFKEKKSILDPFFRPDIEFRTPFFGTHRLQSQRVPGSLPTTFTTPPPHPHPHPPHPTPTPIPPSPIPPHPPPAELTPRLKTLWLAIYMFTPVMLTKWRRDITFAILQ